MWSMHAILGLVSGAVDTLAGASLGILALAVGLHLAKVATEARSWHGIISHAHPAGGIRYRTTLGAFAGSVGANALLPARVGESFRVGVMRHRLPDATVATIVGTIVLETGIEIAFGLTVIAGVLLAGRSIGPLASPLTLATRHRDAVLAVGVGAAVLTAAGYAVRVRVARVIASMARGMSVAGSPKALLRRVLVWKLLAWSLRFAMVYCFLIAFHVGGGLWAVLLVVAAQNLASLLPLAPGSAGTQQAALAFAFAGTVSAGAVVGFGVGMQAATILADLAIGVVAVVLVSSWSDVRQALRPSQPLDLAS